MIILKMFQERGEGNMKKSRAKYRNKRETNEENKNTRKEIMKGLKGKRSNNDKRGKRKGRKNIGSFDSSTFFHSSKRVQRQLIFTAYGSGTD